MIFDEVVLNWEFGSKGLMEEFLLTRRNRGPADGRDSSAWRESWPLEAPRSSPPEDPTMFVSLGACSSGIDFADDNDEVVELLPDRLRREFRTLNV